MNDFFNKENNNVSDDYLIQNLIDEQLADEQPAKKKKKNSVIKNIVWVISIIVVSVGLAIGLIYAGADYAGLGFGRGDDVTIEVEYGSTASDIAATLKESGAVKMPMFFRLYAKIKGYENSFQYGVYTFNTEAGYDSICEMLMYEGAKAETVTVTIPEGTGINDYTKNVNGENVTVKGIATLLSEAGVCSRSDFLAALEEVERKSALLSCADDKKTYFTLEGYLFPETYDFYCYDSEECAVLAVQKLVREAEKRITDEMFDRAKEIGLSMNEVLTLASIVQMEAGNFTDDMPSVAAVFLNRLASDEFSTLGSSPTCYYGDSFRYDDGRYNTYNVNGLPPGPLCSPGIAAINAVLWPDEHEYYYFVTDATGKFYFHKTLAEQNATIAELKKGNNWIYEYFN